MLLVEVVSVNAASLPIAVLSAPEVKDWNTLSPKPVLLLALDKVPVVVFCLIKILLVKFVTPARMDTPFIFETLGKFISVKASTTAAPEPAPSE